MNLIYPGFLFGLAAIAIPVIIHLLQLRRLQRVQFTNTSFIKELALTTARQQRIKRWVVLAMRVLAILFLVLAFCQPFLPAQNSASSANDGLQVVIDTSPSMQVMDEHEETIFTDAVLQAKKLGESYGAETKIKLLNSANYALTPVAYQAKLLGLKPTNYSKGIQTKLAAYTAENSKSRSVLYIFSDFQKKAGFSALLSGFGVANDVVLVPELGKPCANVFVDSVWLDDALLRARTNAALHVRLRNGGQVAAQNCPVKIFLGRQQVAAFQISVAAGQAESSVVQVQVTDKTIVQGRVVTADAPVTFDNTYYFTLKPAAQIKVAEVGISPVAQRLYTNEPVFTYTFNSADKLNYETLKSANLVLVREVPQLTASLRQALRAVVDRGGSVVIVPSAASRSQASYQQMFRELGVGSPQWEPPVLAPELQEVAMPPARQAFFQDVFGAQQRQVTMPRAASVLRWARTDNDILKFRDGSSYLAEFKVGTGRVYVFSAPFETNYSDFANHVLFVPVLYRLAMLSYQNDQLLAYRLTQPALTLTVPAGTGQVEDAGYRLVQDSLTFIPGQRVQGRELRLEMPAGVLKPGFYQLRRQGQVITTLAFNADKQESELAAYSAAELRQLVAGRPRVRVLEGGSTAAVAQYQAGQKGQPLWRYCLLAALTCLLAEALLLRWGQTQQLAGLRD